MFDSIGITRNQTIAICTLLIALFSAFSWDFSRILTEQRLESELNAQNHTEYAIDRVERECTGGEFKALRDCIKNEIEAAKDHARAKQDLKAQNIMARYTRLMGRVAFFSFFLGLGSVALIFFTFKATQVMATDQKVVGNRQTRPYTFCQNVSFVSEDDGRIEFSVVNVGHSPAENVEIRYEFIYFKEGERFQTIVPVGGTNILGQVFPSSPFISRSGVNLWDKHNSSFDKFAHIKGSISYYNPVEESFEESPFLFIAEWGNEEIRGYQTT